MDFSMRKSEPVVEQRRLDVTQSGFRDTTCSTMTANRRVDVLRVKQHTEIRLLTNWRCGNCTKYRGRASREADYGAPRSGQGLW